MHREDLELFERGSLNTGHVLTLRRGEPVFDQPAGEVLPLDAEMCRLAPREGSAVCLFYDAEVKACSIYENRPLECRLLACWAPEELMSRYREGRLQRSDLLPPESAALELAMMHESRCSHVELAALAQRFLAGEGEAGRGILEMLDRDQAIRRMFLEKMEENPATPGQELLRYCGFLFGRPMKAGLVFHGLRLVEGGAGNSLVRAPGSPYLRHAREYPS